MTELDFYAQRLYGSYLNHHDDEIKKVLLEHGVRLSKEEISNRCSITTYNDGTEGLSIDGKEVALWGRIEVSFHDTDTEVISNTITISVRRDRLA